MNEPDYILLIHKSLGGEITGAEKAILEEWLLASSENQNTFDEIALIWKGDWEGGAFKTGKAHFISQRERLARSLAEAKKKELPPARSAFHYQKVATLAVIFLSAVLATVYFVRSRMAEPVTITSELNKNNIALADGSVVTLNEHSALSLTREWNARIADLYGEAFFQLAKDSKPLAIRLPHGAVTITGENFFVKVNKDGSTEIAATSGGAEVSFKGDTVFLDENELATITPNGNRISTRMSGDINFNSWYTGTLTFKKTTLGEITGVLESQYRVGFRIPDKDILSYSFTGTFVNEELETIVALLADNMNLIYEYRDGVYSFTPKRSSKGNGNRKTF